MVVVSKSIIMSSLGPALVEHKVMLGSLGCSQLHGGEDLMQASSIIVHLTLLQLLRIITVA